MCELLGVSAVRKITVNDQLKEFFSHSVRHPDGWGMAFFFDNSVSLEKEPKQASKSAYLQERLRKPVRVQTMIAHIRQATVGSLDYGNCHPFVKRDCFNRSWTLAHNGTIFDFPILNGYLYEQEGSTDSERILLYLVAQIDGEQKRLGRPLEPQERFSLLEGLICDMTVGNKLNLLIYDGAYLYVHTNYANSLYMKESEDGVLFASVPLDRRPWKSVPFGVLNVYQNGTLVYTGTKEGKEYTDSTKDWRYQYLDFSDL